MGCLRGAKPLSINYLPLPLIKGKGIKGIGLPNRNLKGVRLTPKRIVSGLIKQSQLENEHTGGEFGKLHYEAEATEV